MNVRPLERRADSDSLWQSAYRIPLCLEDSGSRGLQKVGGRVQLTTVWEVVDAPGTFSHPKSFPPGRQELVYKLVESSAVAIPGQKCTSPCVQMCEIREWQQVQGRQTTIRRPERKSVGGICLRTSQSRALLLRCKSLRTLNPCLLHPSLKGAFTAT
ncbi:hypothetical protein CDAR_549101 [Caerostris darwini]|uniref:Uncharacterized protein n=1 Tax=Caerostris darwini TaxID=1538125 RepID=A0AAV4WMC0_9ARAC|nr:hypothetical protein CDAR_549101 [Caerostris darwini]